MFLLHAGVNGTNYTSCNLIAAHPILNKISQLHKDIQSTAQLFQSEEQIQQKILLEMNRSIYLATCNVQNVQGSSPNNTCNSKWPQKAQVPIAFPSQGQMCRKNQLRQIVSRLSMRKRQINIEYQELYEKQYKGGILKQMSQSVFMARAVLNQSDYVAKQRQIRTHKMSQNQKRCEQKQNKKLRQKQKAQRQFKSASNNKNSKMTVQFELQSVKNQNRNLSEQLSSLHTEFEALSDAYLRSQQEDIAKMTERMAANEEHEVRKVEENIAKNKYINCDKAYQVGSRQMNELDFQNYLISDQINTFRDLYFRNELAKQTVQKQQFSSDYNDKIPNDDNFDYSQEQEQLETIKRLVKQRKIAVNRLIASNKEINFKISEQKAKQLYLQNQLSLVVRMKENELQITLDELLKQGKDKLRQKQ